MKSKLVISVIAVVSAIGLSSCTGMMLSTGIDYGDYDPGWYWSPYGTLYDGPWNGVLPPRPPRPLPPQYNPGPVIRPGNGQNRPNIVPSGPVINTTPNGASRPGNMGMGPTGAGESESNQTRGRGR